MIEQVGDIDDGLPVDPDREHLVLEPLPVAGRAGGDPHVAFELAFPPVRLGLGIEPGGLREEPFPFPGVRPLGVAAFHAHRELHPLRGAEHQRLVLLLREVLDRREDREAVVLRKRREVLAPEPVHRVAVRGNGPVRDAPVLVRDDQVGVELHLDPEPVALLAGPERAVEREHPGLEFLERHPADRAGHEGRVGGLLPVFIRNEHEPLGLLQAVLHRLGEPGLVGGVEPVDDDLDVLLLVPVELDLLVGPDDLPVDPDPGEPFLVEIFEELLVRPLLLPDDGREDRDLARVFGRDLVGDLVGGLGRDGDIVLGTERRPDPGIEETEVIVDLGDGPDRAAGILGGGLLLDGDGGREPFDGVHVRFLHDAEELPGVRGEGLDVPALAFGVERIERERGFAGAGDSRYDD